jgi:hypothetical protein
MLSFMKVPPTTYVLQYKHGKVKREGAGPLLLLLCADVHHRYGPDGEL